jgi:hypothetical protein
MTGCCRYLQRACADREARDGWAADRRRHRRQESADEYQRSYGGVYYR